MILRNVVGTIVSTQKNQDLRNYKILAVYPVGLEGSFIGRDILALDVVDAGVGDNVLVIQEGASAQQILKRADVPVHSEVVAVIDGIEVTA